eukprot:4942272-Prymnesium_polylepis.1
MRNRTISRKLRNAPLPNRTAGVAPGARPPLAAPAFVQRDMSDEEGADEASFGSLSEQGLNTTSDVRGERLLFLK